MEVVKKKEVGIFRKGEFIVVCTYAVPEGEIQPEKSKDGYLCVINRPIGEYEFWKSKIGDWLEFDKEKRMYKTVNLLEKNRKKES